MKPQVYGPVRFLSPIAKNFIKTRGAETRNEDLVTGKDAIFFPLRNCSKIGFTAKRKQRFI